MAFQPHFILHLFCNILQCFFIWTIVSRVTFPADFLQCLAQSPAVINLSVGHFLWCWKFGQPSTTRRIVQQQLSATHQKWAFDWSPFLPHCTLRLMAEHNSAIFTLLYYSADKRPYGPVWWDLQPGEAIMKGLWLICNLINSLPIETRSTINPKCQQYLHHFPL